MEYAITDFGAVGDGKTLDTEAIQRTIEAAYAAGGGLVVIPAGTFLSGAIFLRQGVPLRIDGTLLGSTDISQYPMGPTRFEGHTEIWPCALINAEGLSGNLLFGNGTIDGNGIPFYRAFWDKREAAIKAGLPFVNKDVPRPRLIFLKSCNFFVVYGLHLKNAAFWNLHVYDSTHVLIDKITVESPHEGAVRAASSDGIDIDASSHVVVNGSSFSVDDDCICIKNGKGKGAETLNKPSGDITIQNCTVGFGHGVVTIGSEASRVDGVRVENLTVNGENQLIRLKFRKDTDQAFRNISFDSITMQGGSVFAIRPWVSRQDEEGGGSFPTVVDNLTVRNLHARQTMPGCILADAPSVKLRNLTLEHVHIETPDAPKAFSRHDRYEDEEMPDPRRLECRGVENASLSDVVVDGKAVRSLSHTL